MSDDDQPLSIALPRSDWLDIERALMTAANYLTPGCPQSQRWFDLLGMLARERAPVSARAAQRRRMAQR